VIDAQVINPLPPRARREIAITFRSIRLDYRRSGNCLPKGARRACQGRASAERSEGSLDARERSRKIANDGAADRRPRCRLAKARSHSSGIRTIPCAVRRTYVGIGERRESVVTCPEPVFLIV
jgi:hypothetical protein